jgi:hypothetical protein
LTGTWAGAAGGLPGRTGPPTGAGQWCAWAANSHRPRGGETPGRVGHGGPSAQSGAEPRPRGGVRRERGPDGVAARLRVRADRRRRRAGRSATGPPTGHGPNGHWTQAGWHRCQVRSRTGWAGCRSGQTGRSAGPSFFFFLLNFFLFPFSLITIAPELRIA